MEQVRRKVFMFGKVDYLGNGKKSCPVEVDLELRETDKGPELSICGIIWNHKMTDCYSCGQNIDTIGKYIKHNRVFDRLSRLWKLYHLNGLHSGTEAQEAARDEYIKTHTVYSYDDFCNFLESKNLLVDNGYRYGSGWLYRAIPEADLKEINELLK